MTNESPHTIRFMIAGRVQGVAFRWFARQAALACGADGTARNLPDGRVEVVARGTAACLDTFERQLRLGPASSRVDDLQRELLDDTDRVPAGFRITG